MVIIPQQKIIMAGNCNAVAFREGVGEEIRGDWSKRDGLNYLHAKWREIRRGERIAEGSGGEREREEGRRKFLKITLYLSLFLSLTIALFLSHAILYFSLLLPIALLSFSRFLFLSLSPYISSRKKLLPSREAREEPPAILSLVSCSLFLRFSLSLSPPPLCRDLFLYLSSLIFFYLLSFFHLLGSNLGPLVSQFRLELHDFLSLFIAEGTFLQVWSKMILIPQSAALAAPGEPKCFLYQVPVFSSVLFDVL